ncbi:MAG: flippase-like domain-containing protein [Paludibacteraceae bacterium]|nr:flippase-like domain-containing protein [Paludibacteraceae bacterium]
MDRKTLYHIVEWSVALAACAFLLYKIVTYDNYAALGEALRNMSWQQWTAMGLCVALMPLNMALEAWRWRTLWNAQRDNVQCTKELSFGEAQRQVYYSKLAGLITPWRLGEYPARGMLLVESLKLNDERSSNVESGKLMMRVLSMGAVGSATMTAAIVLAGVLGLAFSPEVLSLLGGSYLYALAVAVALLAMAFALMPRLLRRFAEVDQYLLLRSLGQSLVRLLCWCVQLALVLWALGAFSLQPSAISLLFVYYLLVTVTPNVPVAEAGVRGAWAILLFGTMNAALAGVLLWLINTLLPCLIWPFLRKKTK